MNDDLKALGGLLISTWAVLLITTAVYPTDLHIKLFISNSILIVLLMLYEKSIN
tara:strand:+ start:47 stop:208 length:162 start_codon:yes stop_codon:yes gene_type:complete